VAAATPLDRAVRALCLAFPSTEELQSHGSPNYRVVGGKIFATYVTNHHGDGRIALWLKMPTGAQADYVHQEPRHFFVPPYVGPRGWLGVRLDTRLPWPRVRELVRMAYEATAPDKLRATLGPTPKVAAPKSTPSLAAMDPRNTPRGRKVMAAMRKICLSLPETTEGEQFGRPVWRAGKRVFAQAYCAERGWQAAFWVGVEAQSYLSVDKRYTVRPYFGRNGWIALDIARSHRVNELERLALDSYRHFAVGRMLARLNA
jgi:hypothetical protein